jgi:hypothetical protein
MKEQANELQGLRGAFARAALAVFTFATLTAWPLLANRQPANWEQAPVALVAEQGDSSIHEDTSCRS